MNPLLLKVGIPAMVFAAIAFMKWTNAKATGSPVFPGLSSDAPRQGKDGGGNPGESVLAPDGLTKVGSTTAGDPPATSDIGTSYATTDASVGSVIPGVRQVSAFDYTARDRQQIVTPGQLTSVYEGALPQRQPSSPTPTTQLPTPVTGGGGHGTYAI